VTQPGIVYRSIFHRRALINGYSGYYPEGFRARRRLAMALPDAAALAALERFTGLELILVHTAALPAARRDEWLALATGVRSRTDLVAIDRDGDALLFRVSPSSSTRGSHP
jgi:hypothetical protein